MVKGCIDGHGLNHIVCMNGQEYGELILDVVYPMITMSEALILQKYKKLVTFKIILIFCDLSVLSATGRGDKRWVLCEQHGIYRPRLSFIIIGFSAMTIMASRFKALTRRLIKSNIQ